jgi:hypothetical protein
MAKADFNGLGMQKRNSLRFKAAKVMGFTVFD